MHADILGLPVVIPNCTEPVLLGAAMSAAASTGTKLEDAMAKMAGGCTRVEPRVGDKS